jgi:hypothetical protein
MRMKPQVFPQYVDLALDAKWGFSEGFEVSALTISQL